MDSAEFKNGVFKKYKWLKYFLLGLTLFLLIIIAVLVITGLINQQKGNSSTEPSVVDFLEQESFLQEQINKEEQTNKNAFIPKDVCPDSISFFLGATAILKGKSYLLQDNDIKWIESNCPNTINLNKPTSSNNLINWSFNGSTWISNGKVPACKDPLEITTPIDMSLVSAILYPGQVRGGDYKSHGGFAFDNQLNNSVIVKLPDEAVLWKVSHYIELGEVQYMLDFMTDCGIAYRFDHLFTVSNKIKEVIEQLPAPAESSETHFVNPVVRFSKGEVIATEIGHKNPSNPSFDFGVYDLRAQNNISLNNPEWASIYKAKAEYAYYGICWLDYLASTDKVIARQLPARGLEGKTSDYCN